MDAKMEQLILDARRVKASDIHITEGMPVWYRVHGKLTKSQLQFSGEELRALLMGSMDERQKEIFASGRDVDFGLEIVCQLEGREMAANVRKTIQCP